jgi:hypothetical protein
VEVVAELADGPAWCGVVERGGVFVYLELQSDKYRCTYGGGEKG